MLRRLQQEVKFYAAVYRDKRTPFRARFLLGLALGYLASPIDLIPDFIPVLGQLDDIVIVPALLWLARRCVPKDVLEECRQRLKA